MNQTSNSKTLPKPIRPPNLSNPIRPSNSENITRPSNSENITRPSRKNIMRPSSENITRPSSENITRPSSENPIKRPVLPKPTRPLVKFDEERDKKYPARDNEARSNRYNPYPLTY